MAEKKYSDIDLSKYANGFTGSTALTQAGTDKQNAETNYQNWLNTGFTSDYTTLSKDALNAYNDHINKGFSYDFNADALYQQYKDKYIQQGKMAMQDTMGQAAAMTGGYGNSYAATVGNQAYQAQLQNLNDVIPELYQMAYDRYNQQGQNLLNQYSLYSDALDRDYGMWGDKGNLLMADRDYYGQEEANLYNREYGAWDDNRTFDQTQYWKETEFGYGQEQDAIANELAAREFALKEALNSDGWEWDAEKGKYVKKEDEDDEDEEDPAPVSSAGKVINSMVKTGTVAPGKTVDKSTASGQRELSSAINKEINAAYKAGEITAEEAAKLKKTYNPRGYTK